MKSIYNATVICFSILLILSSNKLTAYQTNDFTNKLLVNYKYESDSIKVKEKSDLKPVNNLQPNWIGIYDNYVERILNNDGSCDCWLRPGSCRLEIKSINSKLIVTMTGKGMIGRESYSIENKYQVDQISPDFLKFSRNDKTSGKISGKIYKSKNKYFVTYLNEDWQANPNGKDFEVVKKK